MPHRFTRRASLLRFFGFAAAAGGGAAWKLQTGDGAGPLAVSSGAVACVLTPEFTEGPYYVSGEKLRRNVTEGKKGMPLLPKLSVLNARTAVRFRTRPSRSSTATRAAFTRARSRRTRATRSIATEATRRW